MIHRDKPFAIIQDIEKMQRHYVVPFDKNHFCMIAAKSNGFMRSMVR